MAFDILWRNVARNVAAVFALAHVALVLVLLSVYARNWVRFRTSFAPGLVVFVLFFLVQNAVILIFWYILYSIVPQAQSVVEAAAPYLVLINLTETIALGNLMRITLK